MVNHEPHLHSSLKDIDVERLSRMAEVEPERKHLVVAIDDAFDTARRRLQRVDTKTHPPRPSGRVVRLDGSGENGFIGAADGHEVYFHHSAVLKEEFDRLEVGSEVTFTEETGEHGPQASTVRRVGKHHYASA